MKRGKASHAGILMAVIPPVMAACVAPYVPHMGFQAGAWFTGLTNIPMLGININQTVDDVFGMVWGIPGFQP